MLKKYLGKFAYFYFLYQICLAILFYVLKKVSGFFFTSNYLQMKQPRTARLFARSFLALVALLFFHCKKDLLNEAPPADRPGEAPAVQYPVGELSISAAKALFERKQEEIRLRDGDTYSDSIRHQMQELDLIWEGADTIWYKGNVPVLCFGG